MLRLVLDTNVALDWLVFADARFAPLAALIAQGGAEVLSTVECRAEFLRVLGYPVLKLDAARQAEVAAIYQARTRSIATPRAPLGLPQCRDADDQKFLVLATAAPAAWLLTHDRALLALARRLPPGLATRIATPKQMLASGPAAAIS